VNKKVYTLILESERKEKERGEERKESEKEKELLKKN